MPTGQRAALFFRMSYLFLFVITTSWLFLYSFLEIIGIPTTLLQLLGLDPVFDSSMFDFTRVFNIVEYIMLLVQILIEAVAELTLLIVITLTNAVARIPIIGEMANANFSSMLSSIRDLANHTNNFFPHSTITDPTTFIEDFGNFIGATAILILSP